VFGRGDVAQGVPSGPVPAGVPSGSGTHADAWLRHRVTTAKMCRDESRHGRHERLRHIGRRRGASWPL